MADYFEISRRKRNEIDYDRAFVASEADADEIVLCARELHAFVEDWIATGHPRLAKNRREARCTLRCVVARKRHTSRSR